MLEALPRPRRLRDEIAERLKQHIVANRLAPGDRLPTETELAKQFGVSRLSLREATKSLEFLGIIRSRTGVGLTVGQMDLPQLTQHLGFHPTLHLAEPQTLIDSRIIIETGVLPHVAKRMESDDKIGENLQRIVDSSHTARRLEEWIDLDIEFHRELIQASGLSPLIAFGDLLQTFFRKFRDSVKSAEWKRGIASHQEIVDQLARGNVDAAIRELTTHIESHRNRTIGSK